MKIATKNQLTQDLRSSFEKLTNWINRQPKNHFNKELLSGKWTIAGHLYHLLKSTKAVSQGMTMPKEGLATMFGKNNRQERSFQELSDKYESTLSSIKVIVPSSYEAEPGRIFERSILIKRFEESLEELIKAMDLWEEEEMNIYLLPHPAIGKCTIREFIYFTIFHTDHHLNTLEEKYEY